MRIIRPATIDSSSLISTSAPETAAIYNSASTYALGDQVISSIGFDFSGGTLPAGATLTRGGVGYRTNVSGVLVSETVNVARFDYDPTSHAFLGLLVEPAVSNLITKSQTIDTWTKLTGAQVPVVTANTQAAPDGTTTADTVALAATTGAQRSIVIDDVTAANVPAGQVTTSIWLKGAAGGEQPWIELVAGGSAFIGQQKVALTTSWQRFSVTATNPSSQTIIVGLGYDGLGTGQTPGSAATIYAWGAQLEAQDIASSYIPTTTAAAARAADVLTLNWASLGIADGPATVRYRFDDGSTQDVPTTITGGTSVAPTNLNRPRIKSAAIPGTRIYESAHASNTGHALTDPAWWIDIGPSNRWAMFDSVNGTVTTGPTGLDVTVNPLGRIDSVALLNISAATARIKVTDAVAGTIYDQTYTLVSDSGVTDWYAYFYEPIIRSDTLIVSDIPLYSSPLVEVILSASGGPVSIGTMIAGQSKTLGSTALGASVGIVDYSRKDADDFGNYILVERAFSRKGTFSVMVDSGDVDEVDRLLQGYRATPIVWIGSENYSATVIFGFYRDFNIEISYPTVSFCSLEIEGLT